MSFSNLNAEFSPYPVSIAKSFALIMVISLGKFTTLFMGFFLMLFFFLIDKAKLHQRTVGAQKSVVNNRFLPVFTVFCYKKREGLCGSPLKT